jgi:dTDP-4-amino-4,6-dideoxygalactose transaminase
MSKLALLGGNQTKTRPFPTWPIHDERESRALQEVLDSGVWWRTPGTRTLAFEQNFARFHHAEYGIAVTNGTAAIEVTMAALGIGSGDEVIVPDFTFIATASAVLFTGAVPVLVDVTPDTFCIDPASVEAAITPRTKAVIAVHMGGHPADLDALQAICSKHNLLLVEDCAHAHGTEWNGRRIGAFGAAGTFSFQSSKTMTAGEGGIILTNHAEYERIIRSVHDCGRMPGQWFYSHYIYGSNYRLSEWQGAVLDVQLTRLDEQTLRRHHNSLLLDQLLSEIEGITPQRIDERCTRNGHYGYLFRYDANAFAGIPTTRFLEALKAEGIPHQASYPPLHAMDVFTSGAYRQRLSGTQATEDHAFLRGEFPNTMKAAWELGWLPQYILLGDEEDMHEIASAIAKIQKYAHELC